jgi:hypothetical protein
MYKNSIFYIIILKPFSKILTPIFLYEKINENDKLKL